jgi:hypothetical protein
MCFLNKDDRLVHAKSDVGTREIRLERDGIQERNEIQSEGEKEYEVGGWSGHGNPSSWIPIKQRLKNELVNLPIFRKLC